MDAATLGAALAIAKSIPNTAVGDATAADRPISGAGPHAPGRKNLRKS